MSVFSPEEQPKSATTSFGGSTEEHSSFTAFSRTCLVSNKAFLYMVHEMEYVRTEESNNSK